MLGAWTEMGRRGPARVGDLLWRFVLRLEQLPLAVVLAIGLALVAVITAVDALADSGVAYDELYLLPIVSVAWLMRSTAAGLAMAALAAALRLGNSLAESVSVPLSISEAAIHLLLYAGIVFLLGLVRRDRDLQEELAVTDSLTGVSNARFLRAAAVTELERSRRYGHALSLMYIDIDDFKAVNDNFGHREGDRVLQRVASITGQSVRSIDVLARMGGDEFVVLMPETESREARETAERLTLALEDATLPDGTALTCSVGVATYREPPRTVEDLLAGGDAAMYGAKAAGKNRVRHATVRNELGVR